MIEQLRKVRLYCDTYMQLTCLLHSRMGLRQLFPFYLWFLARVLCHIASQSKKLTSTWSTKMLHTCIKVCTCASISTTSDLPIFVGPKFWMLKAAIFSPKHISEFITFSTLAINRDAQYFFMFAVFNWHAKTSEWLWHAVFISIIDGRVYTRFRDLQWLWLRSHWNSWLCVWEEHACGTAI